MKAYVFPGQGSQFVGIGVDLYERSALARQLFTRSCEILGFDITKLMFEGTETDLKRTDVAQPSIFLYSVILAKILGDDFNPDMVGGHSLGEFSALVSIGVISFEDGLNLVIKRSRAMQKACEAKNGVMAAILGLDDETVEGICQLVEGDVVAANYNCPGQLVISGEFDAVKKACDLALENGARRFLLLPVGGAFHSPLMYSAKDELAEAIDQIQFNKPFCPIYQNVVAKPVVDVAEIKKNLIEQLTASVRWTQSIREMIHHGATQFIEVGPGKMLQGLIRKIDTSSKVESASF